MLAALVLAFCPFAEAWAEERIPLAARAEAERITTEMIHLFAECGSVGLAVYVQDGEQIRLKEESVKTAARSRLRSARLYKAPPAPVGGMLRVSVLVGREDNRAFTYRVWFEKRQLDNKTSISDWSPTGWDEWVFGTHGGDANYVLSSLARDLDQFIDDYLRVNEVACENG